MFNLISETLFQFFKDTFSTPIYLQGEVSDSNKDDNYCTIAYETPSRIGESTLLQGHLYTNNNTSRVEINNLASLLSERIGEGIKIPIGVNAEGGYIVMYKGSPFLEPISMNDLTKKCLYFTIDLQIFYTNN